MRRWHEHYIPVLVFLCASTLFLLLRSNDYTAVDGAVRCLEVFHRKTVFFHGNNHLLYPIWILCWTTLVSFFFGTPVEAAQFIRLSQGLNAITGAGVLALLYRALWASTLSASLSTGGTVGLGLSSAFLLHATNSAEAMPGLFFCALALSIEHEALAHPKKTYLLPAAGVAFSLALASYQSMVLGALLGGVFCAVWPVADSLKESRLKAALARMFSIAAGGMLGVILIYGPSYAHMGVNVADMPRRFLSLTGSDTYGGFSASKLINIPFGLVNNLISGLPPGYSGVRSLLAHPQKGYWLPIVGAEVMLLAIITGLSVRIIATAWQSWDAQRRTCALALTVCGTTLFFPLAYWDPLYDKLWLQPLCLLSIALATTVHLSGSNTWVRRVFAAVLGVVLIAESAVNIQLTANASKNRTPNLNDAVLIHQIVGPTDSVVADFDKISILYASFWSDDRILILPASKPQDAALWLRESLEKCRRSQSKLYFIGVLDQSREVWDAFLGRRVGFSYDEFDTYRQRAHIVRTFGSANVSLWEIPVNQ